MPEYTYRDKRNGREITLRGSVPPDPSVIAFHFAQAQQQAITPQVPSALEPPPVQQPLSGQIPPADQLPDAARRALLNRTDDPQNNPNAPLAPQQQPSAKAPSFHSMLSGPITDFAERPIASYLPQWIQDKLAKPSGIERTEPYDTKTPNWDEFPAAESMYRQAARHVTPTHAVVGAATLAGGAPAVVANSLLGAQGAVAAADPDLSKSERIMGILGALGGGLGALGSTPSAVAAMKARKAAKAAEELGSTASGTLSIPERIAAIKTPGEMRDVKAELDIANFKAKPALEDQKSMDNVILYRQKLAAEKAAAEVKRAEIAQKAQVEADKAAGTLGHFDDINDKAALAAAAKEAKRLSLAKSAQALDEITAKAVTRTTTPRGGGSAPAYFTPPPPKPPTAAQKLQKQVEEQIALTEKHLPGQPSSTTTEPPTVPTVDEVMFTRPEPTPPKPSPADIIKDKEKSFSDYSKQHDAMSVESPEEIAVREAIIRNKVVREGTQPTTVPTTTQAEMATDPAVELNTLLESKKPTLPNFSEVTRTDKVLKSNPRFQALPSEERASRYKELGGLDAEARKVVVPEIPKDPEGNTLYSGFDPALIAKKWQNPWVRAALGGTVGYNTTEEDSPKKLIGAALGAAAGVAAAPERYKGLREALPFLRSARYEGLLFGIPEATNVAGNSGAMVAAPFIEALRGNTAGAKQLLNYYKHPTEVAKDIYGAAKSSWKANAPITRFGKPIDPVGPAGKGLQAADAGTKAALGKGGMSKQLSELYTLSGNPGTRSGKALGYLTNVAGMDLLTPFSRTAINGTELGAAMSPLRWENPVLRGAAGGAAGYAAADDDYKGMGAVVGAALGAATGRAGKNLRKMLPTEGTGGVKLAREIALGLPSIGAEEAGRRGYGPSNPLYSTALGPLAAPYILGRGIRDYGKYGRDSARDVAEAVTNTIPFFGDIPKVVQNPAKVLRNIPAQLIPQILMLGGDKTVREVGSVEDALREKLPGWRNTLPARRNFAGEALKRNLIAQYPQPQYETDPMAEIWSKYGLLRREPSDALGGMTASDDLKAYIANKGVEGLPAGMQMGAKALLDKIGPESDTTLTPHEKSRLKELRGHYIDAAGKAAVSSPKFGGITDEKMRKIILEITKELGSEEGTGEFKKERATKALQKYKK